MPTTSSKERLGFFGAGLVTVENSGPPLGNGVLGKCGVIPGAGREDTGLPTALAAAALRAASVAGGAGGGGGGGIAGLLSPGTTRGAGSAVLGDEGGAIVGVGATGLTDAG